METIFKNYFQELFSRIYYNRYYNKYYLPLFSTWNLSEYILLPFWKGNLDFIWMNLSEYYLLPNSKRKKGEENQNRENILFYFGSPIMDSNMNRISTTPSQKRPPKIFLGLAFGSAQDIYRVAKWL